MSVAEIIEEIARLPEQELQQIEAALRQRRATSGAGGERAAGEPDFDQAMEAVFTKHKDVLRRLAQ